MKGLCRFDKVLFPFAKLSSNICFYLAELFMRAWIISGLKNWFSSNNWYCPPIWISISVVSTMGLYPRYQYVSEITLIGCFE